MHKLDTPLSQLTVGEFLDLQKQSVTSPHTAIGEGDQTSSERFVYGLKGLANLFGCSISTAQKIKNSGVIDRAITQVGRKITVDAELAKELVKTSKISLSDEIR